MFLHSCFWAAVDLLSSLWEQLTSTTTSRGIPAPCTLDLCTPCALLVPFVASFLEPICFHIMWIPFLTTSLHLISVITLTCQFPGCSSLFHYVFLTFTDSTDRHWVGMWWGGFLICGVSLVLIAIPFFFFPKELKKEKVKVYLDEKYHHASDPSIRPKDNKGLNSAGAGPTQANPSSKASTLVRKESIAAEKKDPKALEEASDTYGKDIKDIPRSTWKLLTNKIYLVTCLGACMELIIVSGFIVFLPKYLETQFNLSKSMASMFTGGIAIPGACIGIFFGGYILKRLQLRPKGAVQLVIFFNILCLSCYAMLFFFGCDNVKMAGTTMPYFTR